MSQNLPPDGFADEPVNSGPPDGFADEAPQQPAVHPSFLTKAKGAYDQYAKTQYASPQDFLGRIDSTVRKGFGKAGEMVTEQMGRENQRNPQIFGHQLNAGVGTVIGMAPDVASLATPTQANLQRGSIENAATRMARRSIGYQKSDLTTPFARGQATDAARIGLENKVIPWSGNPEEMALRANALSNKSGEALGKMRASVGPQPIEPVFEQLSNLRSRLTQGGARGGEWDAVHSKIDDAEETLRGLSGSKANTPIYESVPQAAEKATPRTIFALPAPKKKILNPGPVRVTPADGVDSALYMREYAPGKLPKAADAKRFKMMGWDRIETTDGGIVYANPEYLASLAPDFNAVGKPFRVAGSQPNIDIPQGNASYYGADLTPPPVALPPEPARIDRFDINAVVSAKNRIGGKVNHLSDLNTQKDTKSIGGSIEAGIEQILRDNGVDMKAYKAQKRIFGAGKSIFKASNKEIAGQEGNKIGRLSMFGTVSDILSRRLPGGIARTLDTTAKIGNQINAPLAGLKTAKILTDEKVAREYYEKAGKDKKKARELAEADGWILR